MTTPKLTDAAVSELPVHEGRTELLEEIMSTPALDRVTDKDTRIDQPHRRRWVAVVAAAASVAAVASAPLWLDLGKDEGFGGREGQVASGGESPAVGPTGDRAVLDATGWTVDHVNDDPKYGGEVGYSAEDGRDLQITWYAADQYDSYVEDRQRINHPAIDPGTLVTVAGNPSLMWPYSATSHTAIRAVEDKFFIEVRASGMGEAAFLELLTHVRMVDKAGFEAALPAGFVTDEERASVIDAMLEEMEGNAPPGLDVSTIESSEPDRYHLGADVAGAVACAWIREYAAAKAAGATGRMAAATDALQASKTWPILREMDAEGDYPEVVWEYADEVKAGRVPEGYQAGLGCE